MERTFSPGTALVLKLLLLLTISVEVLLAVAIDRLHRLLAVNNEQIDAEALHKRQAYDADVLIVDLPTRKGCRAGSCASSRTANSAQRVALCNLTASFSQLVISAEFILIINWVSALPIV